MKSKITQPLESQSYERNKAEIQHGIHRKSVSRRLVNPVESQPRKLGVSTRSWQPNFLLVVPGSLGIATILAIV